MRKIVAGLMVSVDGVVEAPETWTGPYFSPELGQVVGSIMADGDTMLLGRVTYQTFAASFAGNTSDPMAAQLNAVPKVVVSTTLNQAGWENSTLIQRDVAQEITRLKEQPGRNINISGSATLVAWLLRQGLLDELDLLVFPVVVGHGKQLFNADGSTVGLSLAVCDSFPRRRGAPGLPPRQRLRHGGCHGAPAGAATEPARTRKGPCHDYVTFGHPPPGQPRRAG
ncbi:MAG TPA: dihydrofolate reductase family protein [Streptosporangiaceae bacterium]|nr:dihydrofolate reductase family protein [Streptosporangiaceae bacterium]